MEALLRLLHIFDAEDLAAPTTQGRLTDAARVIGHWEATLVRAGAMREAHWTTVGTRADALLAAGCGRTSRRACAPRAPR